MNPQRDELESLARAFAARNQSLSTHQCPEPQRLFDAVSGGLNGAQRTQIIDHVAQCAECSEAWRLAMELGVRPAAENAQSNTSHVPRAAAGAWKFATAASVILGVGLVAYVGVRERGESPQYRDAVASTAPTALSSERLARDRFLLRWSPGPAGSTYTVRLSTADLSVLLSQENLESSELLVPDAVLESVRPGEQLLWQVEVRLPDGERINSATFVVTLQ